LFLLSKVFYAPEGMTSSAMIAPLLLLLSVTCQAQPATIDITEVLALDPVGSGGRVPILTNALTAKLVKGDLAPPVEGGTVEFAGGQPRTWTKLTANAEGAFTGRALRGGFAFASVTVDTDQVMMLAAAGHSYVYVNGEPRGGDPYSFGFVRYPVMLRKGQNSLLFNVGRGTLRARLEPIGSELFLESRDATLPDLIVGESGDLSGAVMVTNASETVWRDMILTANVEGGQPLATPIGDLQPLTSQKVPFRFSSPEFKVAGKARLTLRLGTRDERQGVMATLGFDLDAKSIHDLHKRTYVSDVDGSVQYYAVRPPLETSLTRADALILTVHGAGVEATGQAAAYGAKPWAWIVAATNRRPYGFDWEDWGRIDAMEALADAKRRYRPREDRIYLTGHSMGGHGAWFLGATYPDQWGAIGPCAGWIHFWSYGGAVRYDDPDPIEAMLLRVSNPSDTTKLLRNYLQLGVYVLHGDADQTVPLAQPRQMRDYLKEFHRDFDWHEEPGGGHWYDNSPEPGADCVDYGPMMEFFDRHRRRLSREVRRVEFHTTCPQVSATSHWVTIAQQDVPFNPSSVVAVNPIGLQRIDVEAANVSLLALRVSDSPLPNAAAAVDVLVNGTELKGLTATEGTLWLQRTPDGWRAVSAPEKGQKSPESGGPFKLAFNNRFVLVYGTIGTPEENAWSYAKARYDAETWHYRGNGWAEVFPDTAFTASGAFRRPTNMIVYGNEDTNAIAKHLLEGSPVRVRRGSVTVGDRNLEGDDLAVLLVRPKSPPGGLPTAGSIAVPLFAIVGGTGLAGMRSTDTMPYFVSGVHYPDLFVYDSRIHEIGSKAVRVAGVFGNDWSIESGDIVWRD
jgi:poly(3-hydroxybutyrate) depolymerase